MSCLFIEICLFIVGVAYTLNKMMEQPEVKTVKRLVIIDLNGVFVHRIYQPSEKDKTRENGIHLDGNFVMFIRPFAPQYLELLFEHYSVAIWSSAMRHNMDNIIKHLLTDEQRRKLVGIFDQSHCLGCGFCEDKPTKPKFTKPFENIVRLLPPDLQDARPIFIDDSRDKIDKDQELHWIPTWNFEKDGMDDTVLLSAEFSVILGL